MGIEEIIQELLLFSGNPWVMAASFVLSMLVVAVVAFLAGMEVARRRFR